MGRSQAQVCVRRVLHLAGTGLSWCPRHARRLGAAWEKRSVASTNSGPDSGPAAGAESILLPKKEIWGAFSGLLCSALWERGKSVAVRTSLVAQWLRIHLPMQGTWVQALVREDPTCCGATKPVQHNCWACALEPASHNYWAREPQLLSPCATTTEAHAPRACAPQQEKPLQWEALAPQQRVAPTHRN